MPWIARASPRPSGVASRLRSWLSEHGLGCDWLIHQADVSRLEAALQPGKEWSGPPILGILPSDEEQPKFQKRGSRRLQRDVASSPGEARAQARPILGNWLATSEKNQDGQKSRRIRVRSKLPTAYSVSYAGHHVLFVK